MFKKIYRKHVIPDILLKDVKSLNDAMLCIVPGTKIKWINEKKRYTCIARNDRYIIVAKPFNLKKETCIYSIIDTKKMVCNRDNMIFSTYNYLNQEDCQTALMRLNDSSDPFEISMRGVKNVEEVIEEIWCEGKKFY